MSRLDGEAPVLGENRNQSLIAFEVLMKPTRPHSDDDSGVLVTGASEVALVRQYLWINQKQKPVSMRPSRPHSYDDSGVVVSGASDGYGDGVDMRLVWVVVQ